MGRRNILGNQMESSSSMWIVLLGIVVSLVQFVMYQFINSGWLGMLIGGLCVLLGGAIVHFITGEQEELFSYLLIPCVFSCSMGLLLPQVSETVPSGNTAFIAGLIAWLVPVAYACIFTWAEGSMAIWQFSAFYKKASVFFYLAYFGILIYRFVWYSRIPAGEVTVQLIPFAAFAAYIDGVITNTVPVERLILFLAERIVLFIPYGFFIAMICRKLHSLFRLLLVLLLPVLVECFQLIFKFNSCSADDAVVSFLGGLVGMLGFVIFNGMFQKTTGKNFDGTEVERDYYGRRI